MSFASLNVMILLCKSYDMIALLTLNCPSGHHNLAKPIITAPKVHHNLPVRAIIVGKKCGALTKKQKSGQIRSIPTLYLVNEVFSYEFRYAQRYEPRFAQRYDFA